MASGLLLLLDDISTILDDVSLLTKVAAKKTAGVLGDDLALNAQQVTGVKANRELPIVWAVAKGSLFNKLILVPSALLISAVADWLVAPLLMAGGAYLCFEGCEKLAHKFLHHDDTTHRQAHEARIADETVDVVAVEKQKVAGAIRTDFILSAEIIVITLGTVAASPFATRLMVLVAIALLMTVGVYGLVAAIVKLDDLGMRLITTSPASMLSSTRIGLGRLILAFAPYLMKFLSIAGTAAMFLVGGGIIAHGIAPVHHLVELIHDRAGELSPLGGSLAVVAEMLANAIVGIAVGLMVLLVVESFKWLRGSGSVEAAVDR